MPVEARAPEPARSAGSHRRFPLLYAILLVLLVTGLVPLTIAAYKQIAISRESLITSTQENQLLVASSIARSLSSSIEEARHHLEKLGDFLEALVREGGAGLVEKVLHDRDTMSSHLATDMVLVRYLPASGGKFDAIRDGVELGDEAEEVLARGARTARRGEIGVSEPFPVGLRAYAVALSVPVGGKEGRPARGVLQSLVDIGPLWERATGQRLMGYIVYALDGHGNLFASLDEEDMLGRTDYRSYDIVKKFLAAPAKSKETSGFSLTLDGVKRDYLASVDATNEGWGIFVQVEKRLAYAAVRDMIMSTITWATVALGLALALAFWTAGSIARPVNQLAETARAFAKGDFHARADVRSHSEIGELAETYNRMSDQIQEHIKKLHAAALENQELFLGTIKALAAAIDEKDPYTRGHSDRVMRYSVMIAKELGLSQREVRDVEIGSLLHDVGKIGIDDRILRKPSVLTEEEYRYMKQHPEKGFAMLASIKNMRDINPAVKHHHERWDGSGYPTGLKGDEIPLIARIVNVADTFDAMTTNRPYQKSMTFEKAVARLRELSGTAHDPHIVEIIARLYALGAIKDPGIAI